MKTTKTTCTRETQKAYTARTGKGKQKRVQAKGGQRGTSDSAGRVARVFPRAGLPEMGKVSGRTMFAPTIFVFKKGNGAMWASPPTNPPVSYADIPAQGTPLGRLFKGDKATPLPCRASPLGEETVLLAPLTGHPKGVPCAELASRRLD